MTPDDVTTNLRLAGLVKRFHTWPVIHEQSVAEHSWQVWRIYLHFYGTPSAETTQYVMLHDCGEIAVGDLPFPVKRYNPELKELVDNLETTALCRMMVYVPEISAIEQARVSLCHALEMWEFGVEEMCRGNKFAEPIARRCYALATELISDADVTISELTDFCRTQERKMSGG